MVVLAEENRFTEAVAEYAGFGQAITAEPRELLLALRQGKAEQRLRALQLLKKWRQAPPTVLEAVLQCAVGSAKLARDAAGAVLSVLSLYPDEIVRPRLARLGGDGVRSGLGKQSLLTLLPSRVQTRGTVTGCKDRREGLSPSF